MGQYLLSISLYRCVSHAHLNIEALFPNALVKVEKRRTDDPNRQHQAIHDIVNETLNNVVDQPIPSCQFRYEQSLEHFQQPAFTTYRLC